MKPITQIHLPGILERALDFWPVENIDPKMGEWADQGRCCIGARVAKVLRLKDGSFWQGAEKWAALAQINRAELILLLREAGAPDNPFGVTPWHSPQTILNQLCYLETVPSLRGADLGGLFLRGADLRGADLRGADLREANLREANLSEANLRDARLTRANCIDASFWHADLTGACLWGVACTCARLAEAYGAERVRGIICTCATKCLRCY